MQTDTRFKGLYSLSKPHFMAAIIKAMDSKDQKMFAVKNHIVDICKSYTVIYSPDYFTEIRLIDQLDNIDINVNRVRVNFASGCYLLIQPY